MMFFVVRTNKNDAFFDKCIVYLYAKSFFLLIS